MKHRLPPRAHLVSLHAVLSFCAHQEHEKNPPPGEPCFQILCYILFMSIPEVSCLWTPLFRRSLLKGDAPPAAGDVQDWRGGSSVVQQPGAAVIQQPGTSVQPSQFPCEGCDMPMPQPVPPCHKCHGPFCKHKCKKPMKPPQQPPTVVTQPGTAVIQQPGTSVVQQPGSKIPGGSGGGGQPGQPGTGVVQPGTSVVQQPGTSVVQQPGGGIPGASGGGAQPGQPGSGGQPGQAGGGVVQPGTGVVQPGTGVVQPGAGVVQQPGSHSAELATTAGILWSILKARQCVLYA